MDRTEGSRSYGGGSHDSSYQHHHSNKCVCVLRFNVSSVCSNAVAIH